MPIKKWLRPNERRTESTIEVKPRLAIVESIMIRTSPKWNWKKFVKGCTLLEACALEWVTDETFRRWRSEDKKIWDYYNGLIKSRKEMLHTMMEQNAIDNVWEGINGWVKLRPMDKINVSLRYLEKTSPEFNQSIKVDIEDKTNPLLMMNKIEMEQRIMELSASMNITTKFKELYEWDTTPASATDSEEQVWDGENEGI